jgi:threonine/homoserine/homoserine lactone efflux protein
MANPDRLLAFALLASLLIVLPGPSVLFVVGRALVHGRRGAVATVLGNALGEYALVAAVAIGIGSLVERSAVVFTAVKVIGAAYLIYLGIRTILQRRSLWSLLDEKAEFHGGRRAFREGFVVGVSNPKSAIFFAAILPQFVDRTAGPAAVQMLVLGLIYFMIALATDTAFSLVAGAARSWLGRSRRRLEFIGGASGLVMIGLGVRLAVTGRHD